MKMYYKVWSPYTFLTLYFMGCEAVGEKTYEYPPFDGWFNNRVNPSWGGAETQLLRKLPAAYGDGSYEPSGEDRPNPIELSDTLMSGATGQPSYLNRTALLVFFGQQVVEEILDAQRPGCPPEYFNIPIPDGHYKYDAKREGNKQMPFLRSRYDQTTGSSPNNPRQQLNEISPYIDGSLFYGPNKAWADSLRLFRDGLLAATNDTDPNAKYFPAYNDIKLPLANPPPPRDHYIKPVKRFFKLGNPRGNENPFLLTFGILWFRYHNYKARQFKANHPTWSDEKLFNEARKWTIAVYQKIVMYDWLPAWLGETLPPYSAYDPTMHAGIAQEFQSAAMRFGHTLVPPGVYRRDAKCNFRYTTNVTGYSGHKALRTCNTYWNPQESIMESDIDELLMGMASQIAEREDNIITPDLRGDVFGPLEFSRRDLMALNIQRGRDHGLPDYNTARTEYGLWAISKWSDINPALENVKPQVFAELERLYKNDISNVDIWVGGLLETTPAGPGPLFKAIIRDQFLRIRDGDRFWYENYFVNGLFSVTEMQEINSVGLKNVILAVTNIPENAIQDDPFHWYKDRDDPCPQPKQLADHDKTDVEDCTPLKHFDYFSGSEFSYIVSFGSLGLFAFFTILTLICCANCGKNKKSQENAVGRRKTAKAQSARLPVVPAVEWVGHKDGERDVFIKFDSREKKLTLQTKGGLPLRMIDLANVAKHKNLSIASMETTDKKRPMMLIKIPKEYDMVFRFDDLESKEEFRIKLEATLQACGLRLNAPTAVKEKTLKKQAVTKADRSKILEKFFRVTFAHAFKYEVDEQEVNKLNPQEARDILKIELTRTEFSEAMGLKCDSIFVENMFNLIDKDGNGYVSFREFFDIIVVFSKGTGIEKAKLLFDMYNVDRSGRMEREEFKTMIRSLVELANDEVNEAHTNQLLDNLFKDSGYDNKETITFQDFSNLLSGYEKELNYASLDWSDSRVNNMPPPRAPSRARLATMTVTQSYSEPRHQLAAQLDQKASLNDSSTKEKMYPKTAWDKTNNAITTWFEKNRLQIFWATLYTLVSLGIFIERAYYYSTEREHRGLRRIAGYGVTVTRGAASGIMWTYSTILLTTCRNTITFLRETFLQKWIPFDSAISMHKFIAFQSIIFTCIHICGHSINFYHIAATTADDLTCLFRDYYHASDELPKFHYWLFNTVTGFTGVLLTVVVIIIFTFAIPYARRNVYRAFWITHNLYILLFFFTILHGAGRLVQQPLFHYFCLGPVVLFTLDKLVSMSRKKVEISVIKAELLPSDVTYLEFRKPNNFDYKSGQWARIACLAQSHMEYHPFTLTSAPHEENLSMHIRAVGPWTTNLRNIYDLNNLKIDASKRVVLPKIYLDGPYGEGHQDWYKYDVSVLVGGGIGVTPFASILKDLAYRSATAHKIKCKKVYFIWVTRTQKQFEWMTDIIRKVEENDPRSLVSTHIFITQFKEKFDIRTTMLYICERHFQKISSRSLVTGLRSVTHFGRPDFDSFFQHLVTKHQKTNVFGVFSCGPPPMTRSVDAACSDINKILTNTLFVHHYENF